MQRSDFEFTLPPEQIAQHPTPDRAASRLLCLDGQSGVIVHRQFRDLPGLLAAGDLLVLNDTRVIKARLRATRESGAPVEILVERVLAADRALVHARPARSLKPASRICFAGERQATVLGRTPTGLVELRLENALNWASLMEAAGELPLPPYIARPAGAADLERYQTIYAREAGAIAAPTAGLHFDAALFQQLDAMGVRRATVTLHVGAGTFQPVRVDDIRTHRMHTERYSVSAATVAALRDCRARGGRVIAVGTTSVRALESWALTAASRAALAPVCNAETDIFIYPGSRFRLTDALITNFHLPGSSLLMLVAAFAGRTQVLNAYQAAVAAGYRFYSYGDAMWLEPMAGVRDAF